MLLLVVQVLLDVVTRAHHVLMLTVDNSRVHCCINEIIGVVICIVAVLWLSRSGLVVLGHVRASARVD